MQLHLILVAFVFTLTSTVGAQTVAHKNFQGKWINGKTGYEIKENSISFISKNKNWVSPDKTNQIFYFIGEPYLSTENTLKCWIANTFVQSTVHIGKPESKEPLKEYKVIELKLKNDGKLVMSYTGSQYILLSQHIDGTVPELMKQDFDDHGYMEYRLKLTKFIEE